MSPYGGYVGLAMGRCQVYCVRTKNCAKKSGGVKITSRSQTDELYKL